MRPPRPFSAFAADPAKRRNGPVSLLFKVQGLFSLKKLKKSRSSDNVLLSEVGSEKRLFAGLRRASNPGAFRRFSGGLLPIKNLIGNCARRPSKPENALAPVQGLAHCLRYSRRFRYNRFARPALRLRRRCRAFRRAADARRVDRFRAGLRHILSGRSVQRFAHPQYFYLFVFAALRFVDQRRNSRYGGLRCARQFK